MGQAHCLHRGTVRAKPHGRGRPDAGEEQTEGQSDRLTVRVGADAAALSRDL